MLTLIYERSVESLLSRSKRRFIFQKDNRSDLDESKVFFLFIIDRRGSIDLILGRWRILGGRRIEEEGRPWQEIPIRGWRQSRERNEAILIMGSYMEEEGKRSLRNSIGIWTRHRCRITERSVDIQRVCSCTRELIRLSGFLLWIIDSRIHV